MDFKSVLILSATLCCSSIVLSTNSFAFCGVIKKTASGKSEAAATTKANNAGLVEVRKLEANYGKNNVTYQPAKLICVGGGSVKNPNGSTTSFPVDCTISQKFCVKG